MKDVLSQDMNVSELEGSPSLEVVNIVLERLARGDKLVSLAIGEPMYDTPVEISEAAYKEMLKGNTHYVSSYGTMDVREAIVRKLKRKNSISAEIENTIFMAAKHAIYIALASIAGGKNEVLVPDPGYFYSEPAALAGFNAVKYPMEENGSLDMEKLTGLVTDRTAAIILNTPSNPTGRIVGRDDLRKLLDVARENDLKIISDEAYEDLVYDREHVSIGSLEDTPDHVISIFTLSKSYSMTGWRAGYTVGDRKTVNNMARMIEHTLTCSPPFIQKASAYALDNGEVYIRKFREEFREKRDFVVKRLNEIDGVTCGEIEGAFYAFPRYSHDIDSSSLAKGLLNKYDVALLPGVAFGSRGESHVRISFSGTMGDLSYGLAKFEEYLSSISP